MASRRPRDYSAATEKAEKKLLTALTHMEFAYTNIELRIAKSYRSVCEDFICADIAAAASKETELRLWNAHGRVNSKYRSCLAKFHGNEGKKRPVERRKLEKHYMNFIKKSTNFYQGFVRRLASHFDSPREVLEVAQNFYLDSRSTNSSVHPSKHAQELILDSCHATLIRLGDLARYRQIELCRKERNWRRAKGYYALATSIKPSSGASHNQMAAIASADGDHLAALYHLYRALCVAMPYPRAPENLEAELKKLLHVKNGNLLRDDEGKLQPKRTFQVGFLYLHARLHRSHSLTEYEELEDEVLANFSVELQTRSLGELPNKLALSNIAAQHLASRANAPNSAEGPDRAFLFSLRLNVKTFTSLLRILHSELENMIAKSDKKSTVGSSSNAPDSGSPTMRRIAPTLRHYSCWLVSNVSQLMVLESHESIGIHITKLWRIYADTLTLLATKFRKSQLPVVEYLLEEDRDTIAFTPFADPSTSTRYLQADGVSAKPMSQMHESKRQDPNVETLFRIWGLLEDGARVMRKQFGENFIPSIHPNDSHDESKETGLPQESNCRGARQPHPSTSDSLEYLGSTKRASNLLPGPVEDAGDTSESIDPSISTSNSMHRMVDRRVAYGVSEDHEPRSYFCRIPLRDSLTTASAGVDEGWKDTGGQFPHEHENIDAAPLNTSKQTFTPEQCYTDFSNARPSSLHEQTSAPIAQSSHVRFQEVLFRQQQEIEMQQQSSICELPTSLSYPNPPPPQGSHLDRKQASSPFASPFGTPPADPTANSPICTLSEWAAQKLRFGVVEQLPPSAQGEGVQGNE